MHFTYIRDYVRCNCKPDHDTDDTRYKVIGKFSGNVRCESKNGLPWYKYHGKNCHDGRGADNILPDPISNSTSLSHCQDACEADDSCEGVVVGKESLGLCHLRKNIQLDRCWQVGTVECPDAETCHPYDLFLSGKEEMSVLEGETCLFLAV